LTDGNHGIRRLPDFIIADEALRFGRTLKLFPRM
jgi:hypothetical protein